MSKPNVTPLNAVPGVFVGKPARLTRDFYTRTEAGLVWLGRYPRKAAYTKGVISSLRCRAQQVRQLAATSELKGGHHD
ncbi:hypothetical protein [Ferrimonas sp.]|uniref:hypothetical protein n=1 Tax=Ferrimonas sp. TaxID=2080861 RepID=UPI003A90CCC7